MASAESVVDGLRYTMIYDTSVTVQGFLDAAAARQPTPGGGSVAALTGALAASMGEMTLNYSVGKKGLEGFQEELVPALARFHAARKAFERLVVEDQKAFGEMTAARKVRAAEPGRWEAAVKAGVEVPREVVSVAAGMLELCDHVVNFVNPMLLSDLSVCADLAMVTVRCGIYNARVNLPELKDDAARIAAETAINEAVGRAVKVVARVTPRIWERVALEST